MYKTAKAKKPETNFVKSKNATKWLSIKSLPNDPFLCDLQTLLYYTSHTLPKMFIYLQYIRDVL